MNTRIEHNFKLLAQHDAGGAPNLGEGMAMKVTRDGRRIIYIAHENAPVAFSIFDVTEPSKPKMVWQLPLPHKDVRGNSLAMPASRFTIFQIRSSRAKYRSSICQAALLRRVSTMFRSWTVDMHTLPPAHRISCRSIRKTTSST
jgi:hypothetical protein